MRRIAWVIIMLLCLRGRAHAQGYPMLHYTTDDGLPSNTVYQVYRDSKGFLWFATDRGIARYNGLKFERFTTFEGLPDNEIFFFLEDSRNRLWLATFNGELCYYKNDTFHTAANTPFLRLPVKLSHIREMTEEKDSSVTFVFGPSMKLANIAGDSATVIPKSASEVSDTRDIVKIGKDRYNVTTGSRIITIDGKGNIIDSREFGDSLRRQSLALTIDQDQSYLLGSEGVYSRDLQLKKKFRNSIDRSQVHQVYFSGDDCFLSTTHGLYVNDSSRVIVKGKNVSSVTQDDRGNYWICTLNDGVYVLNRDYAEMKLFSNAYSGIAKYAYTDRHNLFFTTAENNLYELQGDKVNLRFDYREFMGHNFTYSAEQCFLIESTHSYYNFYGSQYVFIPDVTARKMSAHTAIMSGGIAGNHKAIYTIGRRVYTQMAQYIAMFDNNEIVSDTIYPLYYSDTSSKERIFGTAKAPDNSIWYSTVRGMFRLDTAGVFSRVKLNGVTLRNFCFHDNYIVGYSHDNNCFIINLAHGGVFVEPLPQQSVIWEKFYELDSAHILLTTNGLDRILTLHPSDGRPNFSMDAVENPFVPLKAEVIVSDGDNCYFFKNGNITSINLNTMLKKTAPPRVFFTQVKTKTKSFRVANGMEIPFNEARNITLSFSAVSFGGRDITYQYSTSKNEVDNWRDINAEELNLINPAFGINTIKLRGKTRSSDFSAPVQLTFMVLRPFWAQWWFLLLAALFLIFIVRAAYRYRISAALQKKEREHHNEVRFMKSEYKALNALMNPHFIFNTLNNVQSLVNENKKLAANEYLRIFADLIRQNMQNVSNEMITLQKEIDLVSNYLILEKLRFEEKLSYSINIDERIDLSEITVPPLLIQPLVENSIKHGILPLQSAAGFVEINIYPDESLLVIEVKDNGVGFAASQRNKSPDGPQSFGLDNIRKRIDKLSIIQNRKIGFRITEIKNETGVHQWTIATITMPVATDTSLPSSAV